jgi:2-oxoglutarate ferredoxin oxidoreductase subunit delta
MGEMRVTSERCKGCELCVLYCPKKILRMSPDTNSRGYHFPECYEANQCTACKICGLMCPEVAIEVYK